MGIYELVLFPSFLLAFGGFLGRVVVHFSIADHTVRRRIAPGINWVAGIGVALLIGALLGRAVSETDFSKELQIAGLVTAVLLLAVSVGFSEDPKRESR